MKEIHLRKKEARNDKIVTACRKKIPRIPGRWTYFASNTTCKSCLTVYHRWLVPKMERKLFNESETGIY